MGFLGARWLTGSAWDCVLRLKRRRSKAAKRAVWRSRVKAGEKALWRSRVKAAKRAVWRSRVKATKRAVWGRRRLKGRFESEGWC